MINILCFGNPYLKDDNMAINIGDIIKKDHSDEFNVFNCTSPEDVLNFLEKEFIILDVVKDIKDPIVIDDIDKLKTTAIVSLHDFDLAFFLKLAKEMGQVKDLLIIGLPMQGDIKELKEKAISMIRSQVQESVSSS